METRDYAIIGLVILLVLSVVFSADIAQMTGKSIDLTCSDTDNGDSRYDKGTISGVDSTGNRFEMTDYCAEDGRLKEYRCNLGQGDPGWEPVYYLCENGCVDGACIQ